LSFRARLQVTALAFETNMRSGVPGGPLVILPLDHCPSMLPVPYPTAPESDLRCDQ
jgi:hypothetical protein